MAYTGAQFRQDLMDDLGMDLRRMRINEAQSAINTLSEHASHYAMGCGINIGHIELLKAVIRQLHPDHPVLTDSDMETYFRAVGAYVYNNKKDPDAVREAAARLAKERVTKYR